MNVLVYIKRPCISGHPVLSRQFPKSQIESLVKIINKFSIKRKPLSAHADKYQIPILSGRSFLDLCDTQLFIALNRVFPVLMFYDENRKM